MKRVLGAFNGLMVVFMGAPLVVIVWMSLTPDALFTLPLSRFSLRWYRAVFNYPGFVSGFFLSVQLALVVAVVSTSLGFLAAYALVRFRIKGRPFFEGLFLSPLFVPGIAFGIAMLQFTNGMDLYNTFLSLAVAHVMITAPFAVRTCMAAIQGVPQEVEWAARNLGASWPRMLLRITLPLSLRATLAGFVFAFMISFDELTVTLFTAGPGFQTLPVQIYNYLNDQLDPVVAALSAELILVSIVIMIVLERVLGLRRIS